MRFTALFLLAALSGALVCAENTTKDCMQTDEPKAAPTDSASLQETAAQESPAVAQETSEAAEETPAAAEETPAEGEETPEAAKEIPEEAEETPEAAEETPEAAEETPEGAEETPEGTEETPAEAKETPEAAEETPAAVQGHLKSGIHKGLSKVEKAFGDLRKKLKERIDEGKRLLERGSGFLQGLKKPFDLKLF